MRSQTDFQGPLAAPFIESIKKRTLQSVNFVLAFDAEKLDGYQPFMMEEKVRYRSGDILYHGIIDRVSLQPAEDRAVILDYKSGTVPTAASYDPAKLTDFQIPMYVFLTEKVCFKQDVEHAFFLAITDGEIKYIINDKDVIPQGSSLSKTRAAFEPSVAAFLQAADTYAQHARAEDFRKPTSVQWANCRGCTLHTICRTAFTVKA